MASGKKKDPEVSLKDSSIWLRYLQEVWHLKYISWEKDRERAMIISNIKKKKKRYDIW